MKPVVARLVVFGAAVGSLALLAGAVMLVLRLAQPTEYPVDLSREPDGELVGRVARVEPGAILLTSEPPGGGVVPVVVTKDTRVMLGTIEGWMNDVRAGGQIKVAYDLHEGKRLARVVEVLPEQEPKPTTPTLMPQAEAPPPRPKAPPAARPKAEPPRVAQPKATEPPPATPAPPLPVVPAPARVAPTPAPPPVVVTSPAPVAPPPVAPPPVAPAAAPPRPPPPPAQEPDANDGSAAVDWLLKGRR